MKKAFTLIELIVVIAIISILSLILIPSVTSYIESANQQADISNAKSLASTIQSEFVLNEHFSDDQVHCFKYSECVAAVIVTKEGTSVKMISNINTESQGGVASSYTSSPKSDVERLYNVIANRLAISDLTVKSKKYSKTIGGDGNGYRIKFWDYDNNGSLNVTVSYESMAQKTGLKFDCDNNVDDNCDYAVEDISKILPE